MDMGPPGMGPPPNIGPPGMGPSMGPWDDQVPPGWVRQSRSDGPPGWDDLADDEEENEDENSDSGQSGPPNLPSLLTMKIDTPEEFRNKPSAPPAGGVVLPKALEEALAYKDQRQAALGSDKENGNCLYIIYYKVLFI